VAGSFLNKHEFLSWMNVWENHLGNEEKDNKIFRVDLHADCLEKSMGARFPTFWCDPEERKI
jgi:hypothetical protein